MRLAMPSLWLLGSRHMQPLAAVASSRASHMPITDMGSVYRKVES
jgi:hypothetical protein